MIKGCGLTDFEQYASLRRVGRRTRLPVSHREIVWSIYVDYEQQLRNEGVVDYNDLLALARAELCERPLPTRYAAVIADEVQDLNCQAVRLLAEIAGDGERLLLIGDGQQQIYPGYTLAEAGLSVPGRSAVLQVNYRNAADILTAAAQVVAGDEYEDLEGVCEQGRPEIVTARPGGMVWQAHAVSAQELREQAVAHVRRLLADGCEAAGVAVQCGTNAEVDRYLRLLARAGIAAAPLAKYAGVPVEAVKVGTVQRAKGLEFKHVVHPVHAKAPARGACAEVLQEEREQGNRTLFVAMTRARDSVRVGRLG